MGGLFTRPGQFQRHASSLSAYFACIACRPENAKCQLQRRPPLHCPLALLIGATSAPSSFDPCRMRTIGATVLPSIPVAYFYLSGPAAASARNDVYSLFLH